MTAAGGIVFKYDQSGDSGLLSVVLIFRKGVWDLPKGKIEKGEEIRECARREVSEEIGSDWPRIIGKVDETFHEYVEHEEKIGKTTHWFAMQIDPDTTFRPESREGIEEVRWFTLESALNKVGYENLVSLLQSFSEWFRSYYKKNNSD